LKPQRRNGSSGSPKGSHSECKVTTDTAPSVPGHDGEFTDAPETLTYSLDHQFSSTLGDNPTDSGSVRTLIQHHLDSLHTSQEVSNSSAGDHPDARFYHETFDSLTTSDATTYEALAGADDAASDSSSIYHLSSTRTSSYDHSPLEIPDPSVLYSHQDTTLTNHYDITASTHWTPSSYTATSGFKNTTTTLADSGSYWGTTGYGGDSHEHDDLTTETFASHSMSEHPTSSGALLDSDENHSSSAHTGTVSIDSHSWDDQVPIDSYTSSHPTYNDYVIDYSILGGDTGHTVIQAGSVTSSSVNPNSQSIVLGDYQGPIDLSGLSFEAFKTSMETKILLSPVHQLVIPPPPEAAWYAPWNNPDFSVWSVAAWINPIGHAESLLVNFLSDQVGKLSQLAYDNDYIALGCVLDITSQLGHLGAGILDIPGGIVAMAHAASDYGIQYAQTSGSVMEGILAGVGHVTGVNGIIEGITRTDLLTGEHLSNIEADTRFFSGVSAAAGTLALAMGMAGLDVCLANGCFVAGTQVVLGVAEQDAPADAGPIPQINLTGDGALLTLTYRYLTQNIELLRTDDLVLSRDENDPYGRNVLRRIEEIFVRRVQSLQIITVRSSCGTLQTLHTTQAHPVYINSRGWVDAAHVEVGDQIMEPGGSLATVVATRYANYPEGILVYNFRVSGTHTYFVRQQGSTAEPLWVHNVYLIAEEGIAAAGKTGKAAEVEENLTYQTYTKANPDTGEVYSGRTSGTGTPEENVAARDAGHHMNAEGFGPAELDQSSPNKYAIRGREQQLIEAHGGAKSMGGTSGNKINGVSKRNPNRERYRITAEEEFGA
jgi:hypothetical protein